MSRPIGIFRRRGKTVITDSITRIITIGPTQYGNWDVFCRLCHWGNGTYPVGRDAAFSMAHQHLAEAHQ